MAQPAINSFSSYILTTAEEQQGMQLNHEQKMVIQNRLCQIAEAKLALTFDPANVQRFLQEEAELQGQIGILKWLLASSAAVEANSITPQ